jgi:hypothetical protein
MRSLKILLLIATFLSGLSSAQTQAQPQIPYGLKVCMDGCYTGKNSNFGIWVFHGSKEGNGWWTESASVAKLTITSFDGKTIRIHDVNPSQSSERGLTGDYTGTLAGDQIEGDYTLTWNGFNTPGHTIYGKFRAEIPNTDCDETTPARVAINKGIDGLEFEQFPSATACLRTAARNGNGDAEFYLGIMYRDHIGVQKDETQALQFLNDAGVQGVYNAQVALWQSYYLGIGTTSNPELAQKWFEMAYNSPVMVKRSEDRERAVQEKQLQYDFTAKVFSAIGDHLVDKLLDFGN